MLTLIMVLAIISFSEGNDSVWREWGNYMYFISDQFDLSLKLTYTEASLYCQNWSAHLASVHSLNETVFLTNNTATIDGAWFGLKHTQPTVPTDCNCEVGCPDTEDPPSPKCEKCVICRGADKWQWEDETEYEWTNWNQNQPTSYVNQDQEELCARFHGDGKWYDVVCSHKHYFICERALNCYPHFCNSNGVCENNACVCTFGYAGETCNIDSPTTSLTTEKIAADSSAERPTTTLTSSSNCPEIIYSSESSKIICSSEDQTAALATMGVLLGTSLLVNVVVIIKLVLEQRNKNNSRHVIEEGHVYYNAVTKSNIPFEGSTRKDGANPENQEYETSTGNEGSKDNQNQYEKLKRVGVTTDSSEPTTYAELK